MQPEEPLPGSPEDWLRYARSDLDLARAMPSGGILLETLCFHAQQAAEKALKGVLVARGSRCPRTHSIGRLLDLLAREAPVPEEVQAAASLTDYAVAARYPGDFEPVDDTEYREAIRLAEAVVSWAESTIR